MAVHVLVVDDDPLLRRSAAFNLAQAGYRITKPFDFHVFVAHTKGVLPRSRQPAFEPPAPRTLRLGDMTVDPAAHAVTVQDRTVELTPVNLLCSMPWPWWSRRAATTAWPAPGAVVRPPGLGNLALWPAGSR